MGYHLMVLTLSCPLRRPPELVQIGMNVHGRIRRERYRFDDLWGLHCYRYAGEVTIDGRPVAFSTGQATLTPPDCELVWRFPARAPHHYALFRFPGASPDDHVTVPSLLAPGDAAASARIVDGFERAIACFRGEPARAAAWLWELLWGLALPDRGARSRGSHAASGVPAVTSSRVPPAVQTALRIIDEELATPLTLSGLARRVGISANQLLRLFHAHCGSTVMAQVRRQRAERARKLLVGTSLPIRDVAAAVGVPDVHRFNKLMRATLGSAPSALRRGGR